MRLIDNLTFEVWTNIYQFIFDKVVLYKLKKADSNEDQMKIVMNSLPKESSGKAEAVFLISDLLERLERKLKVSFVQM